jgi:hypothetical protein
MVRRIVALAVAVLLTASIAEATDLRRGSIVPRVGPIVPNGPNIVPNPPPERFPRQGHAFRPGVVVVGPPVFYAAPRECASPGYWAYQWVPTAYTQSTFVPGGFRPDGIWVEGHYEQQAYASGYYQPYWVPGQSYAC